MADDAHTTSRTFSTSVVVVSYNTAAHIEGCLLSLLELHYPRVEIIVVDNGSTDGSVELIRSRFGDGVEMVDLQDNKGFAGGASVGLYMARGDFVATVTPDVRLEQGWMSAMVDTLLSDDAGVAGSKIFYPEGKRLQHAGGVVHYPLATTDHVGQGETDEGQYDQMREVEFVTGAALAMRREVGRALDFFDTSYFPVYYEDVDLCRRATNNGLKVVYQPRAVAYHKGTVTLDRDSSLYYRYYHANRLRFVVKHYSPEQVMLDFLPAEAARIAGDMPPADRKASLDMLDNHVSDGQSVVALEQKWDSMGGHIKEIMSSWRVREKPFTSSAPVLGRLIVRLRERLNNLSTRWYVQPILQQQVDYNAAVARTLREMSHQLAELQARVNVQSLLTAEIVGSTNNISDQSLSTELDDLRARIEQLEIDTEGSTDEDDVV